MEGSGNAPQQQQRKPRLGGGRGASTGVGMSTRQLRQRRARILRSKVTEQQGKDEIRKITESTNQRRSHYMTKLYMVIFTAIAVTMVAVLSYVQPAFLHNRRKPQPPMYLATLYPPEVVVERDLPRFFRTFSIATPNNKEARKAVIKVANSRGALKQGTGNLKILLKAWDTSNVDLLLQRNVCGRKFEFAYHASSQTRKDDLVMWCLLATRVVEGVFLESVEMIRNAFIIARKRGMVVRKSEGTHRMSNAYYLHPRLPAEDDVDVMASAPAKVLTWLFENPENALDDPALALEEFIHEAVSFEETKDKYLVLEEICQSTPPRRAIGQQCKDENCCYFVVPENEGGHYFGRLDDGDEITETEARRRSLRDGLQGEDAKEQESSSM